MCTIEVILNYLFHLYVTGEVWKDRNQDNPEYRAAYSRYVQKDDIEYIKQHRQLIAWGNSQTGRLSATLFFVPLATGRITDKVALERYLTLVEASFKDKAAFKDFNAAYPEIALPDVAIEGFWKEKDSYQDVFFEMSKILLRNFDPYLQNVWPLERKKLEPVAQLLNKKFKGTRSIEKWEAYTRQPYSVGSLQILLTTANRNAPSANDVAPGRYNFYYSPENVDGLFDFIQHEIGTNLLKGALNRLQQDRELNTRITTQGENSSAVCWRAFESLAEFYKEKLLSAPRKTWTGTLFDGKPYAFASFFKAYDRQYATNPNLSAEEMMRNGIDEYLVASAAR